MKLLGKIGPIGDEATGLDAFSTQEHCRQPIFEGEFSYLDSVFDDGRIRQHQNGRDFLIAQRLERILEFYWHARIHRVRLQPQRWQSTLNLSQLKVDRRILQIADDPDS